MANTPFLIMGSCSSCHSQTNTHVVSASNKQEEILRSIEGMAPGTRARLEEKLRERHEIIVDIAGLNESIRLGSQLYNKGPLYWNGIYVIGEEGQRRMYRIYEYLR